LGHQPRMRIRGYALAFAFLAEILELLIGEASFAVGAAIDDRGYMALYINQVAAMIVRRAPPEMAEADVVQQCRRLEARDMAAELGGFFVRAQDDRHGVPTDRRPDLMLDLAVARGFFFLPRGNSVAIGSAGEERRARVGA